MVLILVSIRLTTRRNPKRTSMKPTHSSNRGSLGRHVFSLVLALGLAASTGAQAQSLISSTDFFNPDFEARRPGGSNVIDVTVNTNFYTPASQTAGNVTWTHSAAGLVQAGLELIVPLADVQLAAYTRTQGNSLIFGRQLDVSLLGSPDPLGLSTLVGQVTGASAVNAWSSTAAVTNLNLSEGVLYSVTFDVNAGSGLNLTALSSANFSILNNGVPIQNIESSQLLNVLSLLTAGSGVADDATFQFYAPAGGVNNLSFQFGATTLADVDLLGSITDNQTVMEITNFSIAPVPEPGSLALASLGFMILLRRRRLCRA